MTDVSVVLDAGAAIGESPVWSPTEAALYWIDIKRPALYRVATGTGEQAAWTLPADIGAFTLLPGLDGALVALRTGLFTLDFASGALAQVAPPPFDPALFRFNEGACDAAGRFWVGMMFDPVQPGRHAPQTGTLHSYTTDGGLRREVDEAELHNGMAWSADGSMFYLAHSQTRRIHTYVVEADGRLGERRLFATAPDGVGVPDGAAVDVEGGYWFALHGGSRLRRLHANGTWDRDVMLPVSQPTMCAFGGPGLNTLYVTSAADGLDARQLRAEPLAGALLCLRPGETGLARRCTLA